MSEPEYFLESDVEVGFLPENEWANHGTNQCRHYHHEVPPYKGTRWYCLKERDHHGPHHSEIRWWLAYLEH